MKSVKIALKTAATEDVFEAWEGLTPGRLRNFPDPAKEIRDFAMEFRSQMFVFGDSLDAQFSSIVNDIFSSNQQFGGASGQQQLQAGSWDGAGGTWNVIGGGGTGHN